MVNLFPLYCQTVKYCADMSYLFRTSLLNTSNIIEGGLFHLSNSKKEGRSQLQDWQRHLYSQEGLAFLFTSTNTSIACFCLSETMYTCSLHLAPAIYRTKPIWRIQVTVTMLLSDQVANKTILSWSTCFSLSALQWVRMPFLHGSTADTIVIFEAL